MKLPTLFKRTNTNAIQMWEVSAGKNKEGFGAVKTTFGQLSSPNLQTGIDVIKEGKNLGKKNATTAIEQAEVQAKQLWEKKVRSGYVENLEDAKEGKNELGGIKPMLAQVYEDRIKDLKFPVMVQPKLDGCRLISIINNNEAKLFSRTQKPILTVPHIVEQLVWLSEFHGVPDLVFDGELYSHEFKEDFNKIMSIVKRDEVHKDSKLIEYHIYDLPSFVGKTSERMRKLEILLSSEDVKKNCPNLKLVPTLIAENFGSIDKELDNFLNLGYEGLMVRTEGPYEFKRSKHLLKYKKFQDAEFKIVGVDEGKGKLMGHAGSFICLLPNGNKVNVKMTGELKNLKEMFDNFEKKYMGANLTVKFFGYTEDGSLRFPVGMRLRQEE